MNLWGGLFSRLFSISTDEVRFERRGFQSTSPTTQAQLEEIGLTFLEGYHAALAESRPPELAARLGELIPERHGFAFEGAAMALALLDHMTPWKRDRWRTFVGGPGKPHVYMIHIGAGWALARLKRSVDKFLSRVDPLLGWLAVDGYGFHEGYFDWPRSIEGQKVPDRLRGYARRVFDQGLGRSLWFVECGNPERIQDRIYAFPSSRRSDLWSGVGLAATYAGGAGSGALEEIIRDAGPYRSHVSQGAAFAAKARLLAGNPTGETERACRIFCDLPAAEAARWCDEMLENLPHSDDPMRPAYEIWRQRLEERFKERIFSNVETTEATGGAGPGRRSAR